MLEITKIVKEQNDASLQNMVLSHEQINFYLSSKIQML